MKMLLRICRLALSRHAVEVVATADRSGAAPMTVKL
jgi:hypothetical protein